MKKGKILFTIFVLLLLIIQLASAASFSYVTTESPGALCPRQSGLFKLNVKNTDSVPRQYTLNLGGNAASWSTVVPTSVILASQETKEVYVYATPTTTVQPGNYNLDVNIASGTESEKSSYSVNVKNCYGVNLNIINSKVSVCPGDIGKYEVDIVNQGEYTETYNLGLEGQLKDMASLSDKSVTLSKGGSKKLFIFVNSPTDLPGEYGLTLTADAESGRSRNSLPLFLNVNSCYDFGFSIIGESSYNICERTITTVQLKLENKGTTLNEYTLDIEGPVWAKINRRELSLFQNEVRYIDLVIAPDYGIEGDFDIKISLTPKRGTLKASNALNVKVRKCNAVDASAVQKEVKACKGINNDFQLNIKNNGENTKVYRAELDAPSWVTLNSAAQFDLQSGSEKTLFIRALPTEDIDENVYNVKVKVAAADDSGVTANDQEELNIEVVNTEDCYKPLVTTLYDDAVIYYDSSVAIPITIKNNGLRRADYNLFLSGNALDFVKLNPDKISLDPSASETVYLYAAPSVDLKLGDYNAFVTLNLKDGPVLYNKEFKLEVTDVKDRATNIPPPAVDAENTNILNSLKNDFFKYFGSGSEAGIFFVQNKIQVVVGAVILLLIILLFVLGWHKPIIEFFEEDLEDEVSKKKNTTKKDSKRKSSKKKENKNPEEELKEIKEGV